MERTTNQKAIIAFIGPSSFGVDIQEVAQGINFLPPVKRDDINELIESGFLGNILIVDGYFHSQPSVSHSEILRAIQSGCNVWGLSSMGAIRAYEMKDNGMKGYGYVYNCFINHDDFTDDEVALMHSPIPPYHPMSEPLVNIRYFLDSLVEDGCIDKSSMVFIINELKGIYFGDRHLSKVFDLLKNYISEDLISHYRSSFEQYRIKTLDLIDFFQKRPWEEQETYKCVN